MSVCVNVQDSTRKESLFNFLVVVVVEEEEGDEDDKDTSPYISIIFYICDWESEKVVGCCK